PEPAAIHARINTAGVRELAREPHGRGSGRVLARVERLDHHVGNGRKANRPLARLPVVPLEPLALGHDPLLRARRTTRPRGGRRTGARPATSFRATGSQSSGTSTFT